MLWLFSWKCDLNNNLCVYRLLCWLNVLGFFVNWSGNHLFFAVLQLNISYEDLDVLLPDDSTLSTITSAWMCCWGVPGPVVVGEMSITPLPVACYWGSSFSAGGIWVSLRPSKSAAVAPPSPIHRRIDPPPLQSSSHRPTQPSNPPPPLFSIAS